MTPSTASPATGRVSVVGVAAVVADLTTKETTMSTEQTRRKAMLDEVESEYGPGAWLRRPAPLARYVAVSCRNNGRTHALSLHDDVDAALWTLQDELGDWYPVGVVDLDTGAMADAIPSTKLEEWVGVFEVEGDDDDA